MTSIAAKGASALATLFLIVVPIWASPNISDLAHQCNSLGKQNACRELAEIALEGNRMALKALTDQPLLAQIAMATITLTHPHVMANSGIREMAANMLTDQSLLADVLIDGGLERSQFGGGDTKALLNKVTDQALLARIAASDMTKKGTNDIPSAIAVEATRRLNDQAVLLDLALKSRPTIAYEAARKLKDPVSLARVAASEDFWVRIGATEHLTNQTLLASLAVNDPRIDVREAAVRHLWDQATLEKIAGSLWSGGPNYERQESEIRVLAAGAIVDVSALEKLAGFWADRPDRSRRDRGAREMAEQLPHQFTVILEVRRKIQTLGIESKTGRLRISLENGGTPGASYGSGQAAVYGEDVRISIGTDARIFTTRRWRSAIGGQGGGVPIGTYRFVPAPINSQQLIDDLVSVSEVIEGPEGAASAANVSAAAAPKAADQGSASSPFRDNGDATVTDNKTGRMWQKEDDGQEREWPDAESYCAGLSLGGHSDWRLPMMGELLSLWQNAGAKMEIRKAFFPTMRFSFYWSSTEWDHNGPGGTWGITFYAGGLQGLGTGSKAGYVRCMRRAVGQPAAASNYPWNDGSNAPF
jgi:hypothetical protein